jgi:UDPglucose 6-dehydrogenase
MRLAVIGSGYVGLVAAACFAELGHEIVSIDNDENKIARLNRGEIPIHEEFLPGLLVKHRGHRLRFSSSLHEGMRGAAAVFIAVGTPPTDHGEADLSFVEAVSREIARSVDEYKVVVEKSTVPVLTNEWIRRIMLLNGAPHGSFDVASNPEFLREGTAVPDFLFPDRIVIGADNERSSAVLRKIYDPLTSGWWYQQNQLIPKPKGATTPPALIATSTKSAELIKHASNAFLAAKISFINAVANICEVVGADIHEVCEGIGTDSRIGGKFLRPGLGYGGSCFPKDLLAFQSVAQERGYEFNLLREVANINRDQQQRFLRKVRNVLWTLRGKKLAVLGLAFKGGTDDIRESPAISVVQALLKEGCEIRAYDPAAMERAREVLPAKVISYASDPYEAAEGADAALILTDWNEFAALDLRRLRSCLTYPIIVDGRNLYHPVTMADMGFIYCSVGRPDVRPRIVARRVVAVSGGKHVHPDSAAASQALAIE